MNKFLIKLILLFSVSCFMFHVLGSTCFAADFQYQPMYLKIQRFANPTGVADLVNRIYLYALGLIAVFALGAIIYGAILWTVSAGNPSKIGTAKSWIIGAIAGLALLLGAVLLFNEINPNLNILVEPTKSMELISTPTPSYVIPTTPTIEGTVNLGNGHFYDPQCKDNNACLVESDLGDRLKILASKLMGNDIDTSDWRITEACPPNYSHESQCHTDCTCVDANFVSYSRASATNIQQFIDSAKQANLRAVYEVVDKTTYNQLLASGIDTRNIMYNPDASASHFHITKL